MTPTNNTKTKTTRKPRSKKTTPGVDALEVVAYVPELKKYLIWVVVRGVEAVGAVPEGLVSEKTRHRWDRELARIEKAKGRQ